MLTGTSALAIRALIVIGLDESGGPLSPSGLAAKLDCSASYLAKVLGGLVRAGILDSYRGSRGGVRLHRAPADVTLLDITEACQGILAKSYCRELEHDRDLEAELCAFHEAMVEIREATTRILSRWTLADLLDRPVARVPLPAARDCKMHFRCEGRFRESTAEGEEAEGE